MNWMVLLMLCLPVHCQALPFQEQRLQEEKEVEEAGGRAERNLSWVNSPSVLDDAYRWLLQSKNGSHFNIHHSQLQIHLDMIEQFTEDWQGAAQMPGSRGVNRLRHFKKRRRRLVFGRDERTCNNVPDQLPYSALGRIGRGCTGFLLSPYIVMTAAHCIFDAYRKVYLSGYHDLDFYHGMSCGSSGTRITWNTLGILKAYDTSGGATQYDIGFIKLQQPINDTEYLTLLSVDDAEGTQLAIQVPGYSDNTGNCLCYSECNLQPCPYGWPAEEEYCFDCDTYYGTSGAPLVLSNYGQHNGTLSSPAAYVVGVMSAGLNSLGVNIGPKVSPYLVDIINGII